MVFNVIFPIVVLITAGFIFRKKGFPAEEFWQPAEKLCYFLLLPALLFISLATADLQNLQNIGLLLAMVTVVYLIMSLLGYIAWAIFPHMDGKSFGSFHQGLIRFNNYISLPICYSYFGSEGVAIYAAIIAVTIPLSNIQTIVVMAIHSQHQKPNLYKVLLALLKNPLIIGTTAGLLWNISTLPLGIMEKIIGNFAGAALTIGLLCVGAGISFAALKGTRRVVITCCLGKLIVLPLLIWQGCVLLEIEGAAKGIAIIFAASPCAASSFIIAKQMGANAPMMANITALTTVLAMATIPIVLYVFF